MKSRSLLACVLALAAFAPASPAAAENEAFYFPDGLLYIPWVNLQDAGGHTVTNYAAFLKRTGSGWKFRLDGLARVDTNSYSTASTNLTGTWNFALNESYPRFFDGTNFVRGTNAAPVSTNFVLALVQSNGTVSGTGSVGAVKCAFSGEREGDFLAFSLLLGSAPSNVALACGHALVGDGELSGEYVWGSTNGSSVKVGTLSATLP